MSRRIHRSRRVAGALLALAPAVLVACGGSEPTKPPTTPHAVLPPAPPPAPADPLGPRPDIPIPPPFAPPSPVVYTAPNGMTVWLLERHTLPMVSVTVTVPTGASSDPKGHEGLALAAANMLDEGAGKLGAIDFSRGVDQLGAEMRTGATADLSYAQLTVLRRNFAPAMALLGDAVVRPRFDGAEWKRVHDLWINDLKQRASDPAAVSAVVRTVALFGADHPYGHPASGFPSSAARVQLADAKRFYADAWRPDRAVVVAVGDVKREELDAQLEAAFGTWKAPAKAPLPIVTPPAPAAPAKPVVVIVDRPDAPQAVVALVRPGVAASDPAYPPLERVNIALGGSFTSRLNRDLREAHGWTYGVHSGVGEARGVGSVVVYAAIVTEKVPEAVRAMLADIDAFTREGLTDEELTKTRLQARQSVVEEYESVAGTSFHLAMNAALGLPPDYEAKAARLRDDADKAALNKLAATYFERAPATLVIVGPRDKLEAEIGNMGVGGVEVRDAEGNVKSGK